MGRRGAGHDRLGRAHGGCRRRHGGAGRAVPVRASRPTFAPGGRALSYSVEESHVTRGIRYALVTAGSRSDGCTGRCGRPRRCRRWPRSSVPRRSPARNGLRRTRAMTGLSGRCDGAFVSAREETWQQTLAFHTYRLASWLGTLPARTHRSPVVPPLGAPRPRSAARGRAGWSATNQAQVLGRPPSDPLVRASTREAFETYAQYWFDSFHVAEVSDEAMLDAVPSGGRAQPLERAGAGEGRHLRAAAHGQLGRRRTVAGRQRPAPGVGGRAARASPPVRPVPGASPVTWAWTSSARRTHASVGSSRPTSPTTAWWRWWPIATSAGAASR